MNTTASLPARAVITGASRGLGRALTLAIARPGAKLALLARNPTDLHQVADLARAQGAEVLELSADVGLAAAAELAPRILEAIGSPQLVVLNASTLGAVPMPTLLDMTDDAVERTFQVNVLGALRLARRLVPAMLLGDGGTVVSISSDAAVEAYPSWGAYGASKAALDHLVAVWAAELADAGHDHLRLLAVDPGEMHTAMHAAALPDADPTTLQDPTDVARRMLALIAAPPQAQPRVSLTDWRGAA